MEYISLDSIQNYTECAKEIEGLGFNLIELKIVPQKNSVKISVVIASKDPFKDIGVSDCAKAHRTLQTKLIALLGKSEDEIYMECSSPGMERNIKNAAEFALFTGREVRVWDKTVSDWVGGKIICSDSQSVTLMTEGGENKIVTYDNIAKAKFIHL